MLSYAPIFWQSNLWKKCSPNPWMKKQMPDQISKMTTFIICFTSCEACFTCVFQVGHLIRFVWSWWNWELALFDHPSNWQIEFNIRHPLLWKSGNGKQVHLWTLWILEGLRNNNQGIRQGHCRTNDSWKSLIILIELDLHPPPPPPPPPASKQEIQINTFYLFFPFVRL